MARHILLTVNVITFYASIKWNLFDYKLPNAEMHYFQGGSHPIEGGNCVL